MRNITDLSSLGRVKAPQGFEQKVLAELSYRKRERIKIKHVRLSMAGAAATLVVVLVAAGFFLFSPKGTAVDMSNLRKPLTSGIANKGESLPDRAMIPITENVNYSREMRTGQQNPPTVFILEQVSNSSDTEKHY